MFLLEHDGKTLLAARGVPVPEGVLVATDATDLPPLPPGPWMVKAQVPAGGRGKAGGVRPAD
ncbi:MAG: ATP-grasp domain-containing protein, partial [Acetobacterales bacterium]